MSKIYNKKTFSLLLPFFLCFFSIPLLLRWYPRKIGAARAESESIYTATGLAIGSPGRIDEDRNEDRGSWHSGVRRKSG